MDWGELLTVVGSRSIPPSTDRGGLKFYRRLIELSRSFERSPIKSKRFAFIFSLESSSEPVIGVLRKVVGTVVPFNYAFVT